MSQMRKKWKRALLCGVMGCALWSGCSTGGESDVDVFDDEARRAELSLTEDGSRLDAELLNASERARVLITYESPPTSKHVELLEQEGASVLRRWQRAAWVIQAEMTSTQARRALALDKEIVRIELDGGGSGSLMNAMHQSGTRDVNAGVVNDTAYTGAGQVIAIMDSGLDDTHIDFEARVVGWQDMSGADNETPGQYESPVDFWGHGTGVASVAAGSGAGADAAGFKLTLSDRFPTTEGRGNVQSFPVRSLSSAATISVELNPLEGQGGVHGVNLLDENRSLVERQRSDEAPFNAVFADLEILDSIDAFHFAISLYASSSDEVETAGSPYEAQLTIPFEPRDDAPLTQGAAPASLLYGLKVLDDDGNFSSAAPILDAIEWVYDNGVEAQIAVVNASLNFNRGGPNTAVDSAINRLVSDTGILFVASARNGQADDVPVASPATADLSVAVGAINVYDQVTSYSSIGDADAPLLKPDLVAPGGSSRVGRMVTADANGTACKSFARTDCVFESDRFQDDYRTYTGTSFAAPHVAGVLALMLEARGGATFGDSAQALELMALLKMTASEVSDGEEAAPGPPGRSQSPKDPVEGYGRLNTPAALEALTVTWDTIAESEARESLGGDLGERRAWARRVNLSSGEPVGFVLENPPDADYDVMLYSASATSQGEPILLAAADRDTAGTDDNLFYQANVDREAILVVKRVRGDGEFGIRRQDSDELCLAPDLSLLGEVCSVGIGECQVQGRYECAPSLRELICDVVALEPGDELCGTGADEDCDGVADEGFELIGDSCSAGLGQCARQGSLICAEDGAGEVCSVEPGEPSSELCGDDQDNDCDGVIDEGFETLGESCALGIGACAVEGFLSCGPNRVALRCPVEPLAPAPADLCGDAIDNDCDGTIDEGFEDLGEPCTFDFGVCSAPGVLACSPDGLGTSCSPTDEVQCATSQSSASQDGCQSAPGRPHPATPAWLLLVGLLWFTQGFWRARRARHQ